VHDDGSFSDVAVVKDVAEAMRTDLTLAFDLESAVAVTSSRARPQPAFA
jgi:hypothetical protein